MRQHTTHTHLLSRVEKLVIVQGEEGARDCIPWLIKVQPIAVFAIFSVPRVRWRSMHVTLLRTFEEFFSILSVFLVHIGQVSTQNLFSFEVRIIYCVSLTVKSFPLPRCKRCRLLQCLRFWPSCILVVDLGWAYNRASFVQVFVAARYFCFLLLNIF